MPFLKDKQCDFVRAVVELVAAGPDETEEYFAAEKRALRIIESVEAEAPPPALIGRLRDEYNGARLLQPSPGHFAARGPGDTVLRAAQRLRAIERRADEISKFLQQSNDLRRQLAKTPIAGFEREQQEVGRLLDAALSEAGLGRDQAAVALYLRADGIRRSLEGYVRALELAQLERDQWASDVPQAEVTGIGLQIAGAKFRAAQGDVSRATETLEFVSRSCLYERVEHLKGLANVAVSKAAGLLKKLDLSEEFNQEFGSLRTKYEQWLALSARRNVVSQKLIAGGRSLLSEAAWLEDLANKHATFSVRDSAARQEFELMMQTPPLTPNRAIRSYEGIIKVGLQRASLLAEARSYDEAFEALDSVITTGQRAYQCKRDQAAYEEKLAAVKARVERCGPRRGNPSSDSYKTTMDLLEYISISLGDVYDRAAKGEFPDACELLSALEAKCATLELLTGTVAATGCARTA